MSFLLINKSLRLNNLKTRTTMNVKISVFVICVKAIIYLLLYNLHDCTFKVRILDIPKLSRNAKGYLISQNFWGMLRDKKNKNSHVNNLITYISLTALVFLFVCLILLSLIVWATCILQSITGCFRRSCKTISKLLWNLDIGSHGDCLVKLFGSHKCCYDSQLTVVWPLF